MITKSYRYDEFFAMENTDFPIIIED